MPVNRAIFHIILAFCLCIKVDSKTVRVSECSCTKFIPTNTFQFPSRTVSLSDTTCSHDVFVLGPDQKVLSYTFYGGDTFDSYDRDYFAGVEENLRGMKELYPDDFRMRLYYDIPKGGALFERLCDLACKEPRLDICDVTRNPKFGNIR